MSRALAGGWGSAYRVSKWESLPSPGTGWYLLAGERTGVHVYICAHAYTHTHTRFQRASLSDLRVQRAGHAAPLALVPRLGLAGHSQALGLEGQDWTQDIYALGPHHLDRAYQDGDTLSSQAGFLWSWVRGATGWHKGACIVYKNDTVDDKDN